MSVFMYPIFAQNMDSLRQVILLKFKSEEIKKEAISDLKGKSLPPFELTQLNGQKISSESLKGKPTIINFWFVNCQHCINEMPAFNYINSQFGEKVNFLAITFETKNEVSSFLRFRKFDFTHIIEAKAYIDSLNFIGYPRTLILDKDLVVSEIIRSMGNNHNDKLFIEDIVQKLNKLLELQK